MGGPGSGKPGVYSSTNERQRTYARKTRKVLNALKDVPCMDCGVMFPPECMDFDHVRGDKLFNIGGNVTRGMGPMMLEEIAKCDIVCANCHRTRTKARSLM